MGSLPGSGRILRRMIIQYIKERANLIVPITERGKLLDIGGGTGDFTINIANILRVEEIHLVDINEEALEEARKRAATFKGVMVIHKLDASHEKLPFPNNYFDVVLMIEVLEHLYNPDHAISEVKRVLREGGLLILTTPNLAWWVNRLVLLLGFQPYNTAPSIRFNVGKLLRDPHGEPSSPEHIRLFTYKALKQFIMIYGFEILLLKGAPGEHNSKFISIIDSLPSKRASLAAQLILIARKSK